MGQSLHADTAYLPTWAQTGTGLGMFLFVPLGDMYERRTLICLVAVASAIAAVLTALSPTVAILSAAGFLVGLTNVVPHLIIPFAAQISAPEARGRVLGTVLSGLLIGILLARTLAGFVGAAMGWRAMYWLAAAIMVTLAATLRLALPESKPAEQLTYSQLLSSLGKLTRSEPLLREAALIGGLLFGSFSAFWATLIFVLSTPPYHYGPRMAGLFGLIGLAGALAASVAGRFADRRGPSFTVAVGIVTTAASWLLFLAIGGKLWGLTSGVILLDLGVQTGHVANQTRIYALNPAARSRLNTIYMVTYFAGGALGSALSAVAWHRYGLTGVCSTGFLLALLAASAAAVSSGFGRVIVLPRKLGSDS